MPCRLTLFSLTRPPDVNTKRPSLEWNILTGREDIGMVAPYRNKQCLLGVLLNKVSSFTFSFGRKDYVWGVCFFTNAPNFKEQNN